MPAYAGKGTGSAAEIVPCNNRLVYSSASTRYHVLTNAHGHFVALLCRDTGVLMRLNGAQA